MHISPDKNAIVYSRIQRGVQRFAASSPRITLSKAAQVAVFMWQKGSNDHAIVQVLLESFCAAAFIVRNAVSLSVYNPNKYQSLRRIA
jgi:hypothetical protein